MYQCKAKQKGMITVSYSLGLAEAVKNLCMRGGMMLFALKKKKKKSYLIEVQINLDITYLLKVAQKYLIDTKQC